MDSPDEPRVHTEKAKNWQRDRARGIARKSDNEKQIDYSAIIFPDCPGLCNAARVVAGSMADRHEEFFDQIIATQELLEMLGIIAVMENGGDGRKVRIQRGPVSEPTVIPPGYHEDDIGQAAKKTKKRS